MFKRPTTIIVGAGCSFEYGLPLGDGLRKDIANLLENVAVREPDDLSGLYFIGGGGPDDAFNRSIERMGGQDWPRLFGVAQTMSAGLAHASSIDRFLDIHRDDASMVEIGKMAIGRLILKAEANSSVMVAKRGGNIDMDAVAKTAGGPNWLHQLFLRMQEGVRRNEFDQILSNVTFISFNYDRVIEHYLFHAVSKLANLPADATARLMESLRVYHPYGSLGQLPWQANGRTVVEFGGVADHPNAMQGIAANLRIFTETIEENDDIRRIRKAIQDSEQIIFVGFSFLQQNLDLLRPAARSAASRVYGTTFNESPYNVEAARTAVSAMLNGQNSEGFQDFRMQTENTTAGQFFAMAGNLLAS